MKLVVLAGAKRGATIPLKKDKFVIGRSSQCTLRTGSESISRHHCAILKSSEGHVIRDLGSRNGTLVNGEKITEDVFLQHGDTITIGSLEFRFELSNDIDRSKKPKVQNVADAVSRTAIPEGSSVIEEDISRWLVGSNPSESAAMRETQTFRIDETQTIPEPKVTPIKAQEEPPSVGAETGETIVSPPDKKKQGKKPVGKLPPLPPKNSSKDSRDAATEILREMARRR